jgi:hypothetical protein
MLIAEMNYLALAITSVGYFRFLAGDFKTDRPFTDFLLLPNEYMEDKRMYFYDLDQILEQLPIKR